MIWQCFALELTDCVVRIDVASYCTVYTEVIIYDRDHSAGNAGMRKRYQGLKVYGGYGDNVPDVTKYVQSLFPYKYIMSEICEQKSSVLAFGCLFCVE